MRIGQTGQDQVRVELTDQESGEDRAGRPGPGEDRADRPLRPGTR